MKRFCRFSKITKDIFFLKLLATIVNIYWLLSHPRLTMPIKDLIAYQLKKIKAWNLENLTYLCRDPQPENTRTYFEAQSAWPKPVCSAKSSS